MRSRPRCSPHAVGGRVGEIASNARARYRQVIELREQGVAMHVIAQALKMSRMTVRRDLAADGFPERAQSRTGPPLSLSSPGRISTSASPPDVTMPRSCGVRSPRKAPAGGAAMVRRYAHAPASQNHCLGREAAVGDSRHCRRLQITFKPTCGLVVNQRGRRFDSRGTALR